jgi:hypothetical protein
VWGASNVPSASWIVHGTQSGQKDNDRNPATAYLVWIAREYPQVACAMLARMMPQQTETTQTVDVTYHTYEEITNKLRELGLPAERIYPLLEGRGFGILGGRSESRRARVAKRPLQIIVEA